ncbi:SDR family NAD(P)-dependent oxidoreductase [Papillibacter cinnamivorans]|uniref:NAD(P)-dependent dehydrogenase, short-chain alcohol dehydrogenase family n=1 Tax=Papillibacter cinnamivorans DSM 12816 TaxID=1122930 RepID=A0A1W1YJN5_9FIRM|nr:SDR family oxidoreductase [Papillibacter cinnamivorans]SMC36354.1 NAD(P)-dependent dehydrogenase, short-chain alcohol dehydrogenase family [Papillibacter cinnamivorans DSM 12816]
MGRLEGKIAVITGASSGYGRRMAIRFAREGAKVACLDLTTKVGLGLEDDDDYKLPTHEQILKEGGKAIYVTCDISSQEQVIAAFKEVDKQLGILDIVVNNAGIYAGEGLIHEQNDSFFKKCVNVNIYGSWYCSQEALKRFVPKKKGKVIQMASSGGIFPNPLQAPYNISKAAVISMIKNMACEYGEYQINCNAICPSWGMTPMGRALYLTPKFNKLISGKNPMGRWVHPEDVANYAVFLASEESNFVTGTTALIDGGLDLTYLSTEEILEAQR